MHAVYTHLLELRFNIDMQMQLLAQMQQPAEKKNKRVKPHLPPRNTDNDSSPQPSKKRPKHKKRQSQHSRRNSSAKSRINRTKAGSRKATRAARKRPMQQTRSTRSKKGHAEAATLEDEYSPSLSEDDQPSYSSQVCMYSHITA